MQFFNLSNAQKRTIVTEIGESGNDSYVLSFKYKFPVEDEKYVKIALSDIIRKKFNLRIKKDNQMEFSQYFSQLDPKIDNQLFYYYDMSIEKEDEIKEFIYQFTKTGFDEIFDSPLYRFVVLKTRKNIIVLGNVHHILMDGTSINIFIKNLKSYVNNLKNNQSYEITSPSYEKYVKKEEKYLSTKKSKEDEKYWVDSLKNYSSNYFTLDNLNVSKHEILLEENTIKKLKEISIIENDNISPFLLALSILSLYFFKSSKSKDLVWNTPYHGRDFGDDTHNMLGMFVNMMPLRLKYKGELTFKDYVLYVKSVLKKGLSHGKLSFNLYTQKLQKIGINPAMLSMYSIVSNSSDSGVEYIWENEESEFPLHIRVNSSLNDKNGLQSLFLEFNKGCYSHEAIIDILNGIKELINEIADNPNEKCGNFKVLQSRFFRAEKYFKNIVKKSDGETFISPDIQIRKENKDIKEKEISINKNLIKNFSKKIKISPNALFLTSTLLTLNRFVFNKNILISRTTESNGKIIDYPFGLLMESDKTVKEMLIEVEDELIKSEEYKFFPYDKISGDNIVFPDFKYYFENKEYNSKNDYLENSTEVNSTEVNFNEVNSDEVNINEINDKINNSSNKAYLIIKSIDNDEYKVSLYYNAVIYTEKLMETFIKSIEIVLKKLINDQNEKIGNISILSDKDIEKENKRQEDFEENIVDEPLLNKAFENTVKNNNDKIALIASDGEFTYDELNKKANRIANALIKRGVGIEDKIMFMMNRDSNLIATVIGIVKSGATFIPIDPEYPKDRIENILDDSTSKYIVTNENTSKENKKENNKQNNKQNNNKYLKNQISINELLKETDERNPNPNINENNLAYIIYTSGSTGIPKGVMLTHKGITNYISNDPQNIPINSLSNKSTKFLSLTTVSFIVFLREIFATMINGVSVVFANEEESINPLKLIELINNTNPDAFGSTPSRMLQYLELEKIRNVMKNFKVIIVGGEMFPSKLYNTLKNCAGAEIYNSYGPTEITIASHGKLMENENVSEGKTLLNVIDSIRDIDGNPLPPGVVGEVYIGGSGVARGYLNNKKLTEEKFLEISETSYYKTGDLGKKDEFGELYVSGRVDSQVKVRGLRIEVGEIESVISKNSNINSLVVCVKDVDSEEHLCAYYTSKKEIDINELRNITVDKLPKYMVPSYFIQLENFPMTPNGKIDIRNLPLPEESDYGVEDFVNPENELEESIFNICSNIMGKANFGVTNDLFQIGFTSLSIIKLISKISDDYGVELNLVSIMREGTIRKISQEILKASPSEELIFKDDKIYSLTQNQLGVYFDCIKNPDTLIYNMPKCIRLNKNKDIFDLSNINTSNINNNDSYINASKLKNVILKAIEKHSFMKTHLYLNNGKIYQRKNDNLKVDIEIHKGTVDKKIKKNFIKPFDLFKGPLFRFEIYEDENEVFLLWDCHHIISDGFSTIIFLKDLAKLYEGKNVEIEKYTGFDLALEESEIEKTDLYNEAENYFDNRMCDFEGETGLTPDINGKENDGLLKEKSFSLNKDRIETFCKNNSITPNIFFMGVILFSLSKHSYNKDILISTISNGRSKIKYQKTFAMMVRTLAIVSNIDSEKTVIEFMKILEDEFLNTINYESYPFTKISDKYGIYPDIFYAYQAGLVENININGYGMDLEILDIEKPKFKLSIIIEDKFNEDNLNEDQFRIVSKYNNALYSEDLINGFNKGLSIIIKKFIENPNSYLKNISILSEKEQIYIENEEKSFKLKPVKEQLLNIIFQNIVEENKDKIALIAEDGELSYDELNKKSNRIANALIKLGVKAEDKIMFMLKRDSNLIATILGIIKSGAGFIPIDPEYPEDRIKHVLNDSESKYIITKEDLPNKLNIDDLLKETNERNPNPILTPKNLAYSIYTSGSTGKPKGVILTHENIANYIFPNKENCFVYSLNKMSNRMLSITTVAFDVFLHEIFVTLMNGLTLVFANDEESKNPLELAKLFEKTGADSFSATPSRMLQYLEFDRIKKSISQCKIISLAGENYPLNLHKIIKKYSDAEIYNVYGPTETTISCNTKCVDNEDITVGKPLFNVIESVMDIDGNPLPPGIVGELYVGGAGVARGYWNRKELTDGKFIYRNNIRYYRTGDFAKKKDNGEYYILGRMDNQIKLRGLRIEIGEIENVISDYEGVKRVIVLVKKIQSQEHLCAYFTSDKPIDVKSLKSHLKNKLTPYMIPNIYMELDEFPQTPNGKIDIKSLPEPLLKEKKYVAAKNKDEKFFADVFANVLGINKVGATDSFFDLGGTSLLATKVMVESVNAGYNISYGDIFAYQTPENIARVLLEKEKTLNQPKNLLQVETEDPLVNKQKRSQSFNKKRIDLNIEGIDNLDSDFNKYSTKRFNDILKKQNLEQFKTQSKQDLGNVLLTGTTGFLGMHLLNEFIKNENGKIYCMLRKGRHTDVEKRLKSLLFYYFDNSYDELFNSKIHVIEGDVTNIDDFKKAASFSIDTVLNSAANVKHYASGTQIEDVNVGGVKNAVKFSKENNCNLVHISTASVAGESVNNIPPKDIYFEEDMLYIGQNLEHKYINSKFKAETIILDAVLTGEINAKIMRLGNLMAREQDQEFQINFDTNAFINRLKSYSIIKRIPYNMMNLRVDITAIDSTAKAIMLLSKTPKEYLVFHPFNNHYIYISDIISIMNKLGLNIKGSNQKEFNEALQETMKDESNAIKISGFIASMNKGENRSFISSKNDYTMEILYHLGFKWPLITNEYLSTFIKYLIDLDFFD